ncbi:RNA polymerase sigma-70 factor (ECF subfamily) [Symbiobacterium terraclitae]|uniref:RNA polymerase sigma factor n=1 Tax=Symbiobacterium terraclitae TaxID=557451 RepID=A0ABS4JMN0_9FIRM|nr:RNA polymerase sigma-70 factor (ECF subfamily) [Symbiobacterium terraclitae]
MDDLQLIRQAQRGDQAALARLLQAQYLPVKKYLVTITFDRNLAEDLTQETMIRAIERIGQFEGRARFSTWLCSIATRLYLDWLRRQKRQRQLQARAAEELLLGQQDTSPEVRSLMAQLQALPREVALPVVLKHYYGYTYEEIAEWMEIPVGTVKSRIFNAVRTLRRGLDQDEA